MISSPLMKVLSTDKSWVALIFQANNLIQETSLQFRLREKSLTQPTTTEEETSYHLIARKEITLQRHQHREESRKCLNSQYRINSSTLIAKTKTTQGKSQLGILRRTTLQI